MLRRPGTLLWAEGDEAAEVAVLGLPFDATASYRAGARFGPLAIREASQSLELYAPLAGRQIDPRRVVDLGDVEPAYGRPDPFLAAAEAAVADVFDQARFPLLLGGEHGVTLAGLRAARRFHPDLVVLQYDAHADLRSEYRGEPYSHAAVMYHAQELLGRERVFQLGVRSGEEAEFQRAAFLRSDLDLGPFLGWIGRSPVYVTVDVDVLDPSAAPGTGTPEPGGWSFGELLRSLLLALRGLWVVALDVVEVAPPLDPAGITALAAAKLLRECTAVVLGQGRRR